MSALACRACGCTDHNPCIVHPVHGRMGFLSDHLVEGDDGRVVLEALEADRCSTCSWVSDDPPLCSACASPATRPPLLYDAYGRPAVR